MGFLKFDSPFMRFLSQVADLVIVNFLVLICSLPIFTIGASLTAMQTILYRIMHNEDVYVIREFFESFKKNFKQSTKVWLILLPILLFLAYDYAMLSEMDTDTGMFLKCIAVVMAVIIGIIMLYLFPILSRYENTIKETIKNSIILAITHPVRSIAMAAIFGVCIFLEIKLPFKLFPLLVAFCVSLPWCLCAMLYVPMFDRIDGIVPESKKDSQEE